MKPIRTALVAAACGALFAPACATHGPAQTEMADAARADAKVALQKRGPTLALDETAKLADPTALQLLEERSQELAKARKRVGELEVELAQRARDLAKVQDESRTKSEEKEQLAGLLRDATESERAATEKALSAEIARLRFEQELLRMKLGNLVRETP